MMSLEVILKNGFIIEVECEAFTINHGQYGTLESVEFYNVVGDKPEYLDPADISSIVRKGDKKNA